MKGLSKSIGTGKIIVEFFSVAISVRVWRNLSCKADGAVAMKFAASASFCEAWNSPEASTDGENCEILTTPSGTGTDPQGSNYGWGYTGYSGGKFTPVWISESVDISKFAGQNLLLRFEYITDSNVTGEGILLDDLSIPEIGYSEDFETSDVHWLVNGWARIQNVLPQTYELALISEGDVTDVPIYHDEP